MKARQREALDNSVLSRSIHTLHYALLLTAPRFESIPDKKGLWDGLFAPRPWQLGPSRAKDRVGSLINNL